MRERERERVECDNCYQVRWKVRCSVGGSELGRYNWEISIDVVRKVVPVDGSVRVLTWNTAMYDS